MLSESKLNFTDTSFLFSSCFRDVIVLICHRCRYCAEVHRSASLLLSDITWNQQRRLLCVTQHCTDLSSETWKQTGSSSWSTQKTTNETTAAGRLQSERSWCETRFAAHFYLYLYLNKHKNDTEFIIRPFQFSIFTLHTTLGLAVAVCNLKEQ